MTNLSHRIITEHQVRKTRKQKEAFRAFLCRELEALGYASKVEEANFSRNVVVGNPSSAKVIYTAHYDTPPVIPVPNFITPRNFLWYLLYQLLLVIPMFVLAFGAEVALLLLWEDCPMWLALGTVYLVLGFMLWWMMSGPANKHTMNDNTSGVVTLVEIAQALPAELRDGVCFIFFDNEEKGLLGSSGFAAKHKVTKNTALVLNFDCVSDGESIQFFPGKLVKGEADTVALMEQSFLPTADKTVEVVTSFGLYPSDQSQFKRGVGVCALKHSRIFGWYMDRIHTGRDTVMMEENIRLLADGAVRMAQALVQ